LIKQVRSWLIGVGAVSIAALATLWVFLQVDIGSLKLQLFPKSPVGLQRVVSLLCTGGERIADTGKAQPTTNPVSFTVRRDTLRVNVFVEGEGSAYGDIIEDDESHVSFGVNVSIGGKPCDEPAPAECKVANGEISRHTGRADVTIKDKNGQTVVGWKKLECQQMSGKS
jgi:hypothetical protein